MENILLQANQVVALVSIGTMVMLSLALALVLIFFHFQRQKIKTQEETIYKILHAQEQERQVIAKDLHDEVGSKLTVIHLYLHSLIKNKEEEDKFTKIHTDTKNLLNKAILSTRKIAHHLIPPTLEKFGFFAALEELCNEYAGAGVTKVNLNIDKKGDLFLEKEKELDLFRIFQELFNNSIKHAQAKDITVDAISMADKFLLTYKDNGKGFNKNDPKISKGLGLKNIENRLKVIGAVWEVDSAYGEGMSIKIEIHRSA